MTPTIEFATGPFGHLAILCTKLSRPSDHILAAQAFVWIRGDAESQLVRFKLRAPENMEDSFGLTAEGMVRDLALGWLKGEVWSRCPSAVDVSSLIGGKLELDPNEKSPAVLSALLELNTVAPVLYNQIKSSSGCDPLNQMFDDAEYLIGFLKR